MNVIVNFEGLAPVQPVTHDMQAGGLSPVVAIERAIEAHIVVSHGSHITLSNVEPKGLLITVFLPKVG